MDREKEKERNEDRKELMSAFSNLKEKYNLPDFESLSRDFQIENIDPSSNIIRNILGEMHETIDFYSRILEGLIQPDSKLSDMKESGNLSESDHEIVSATYNKCMLLTRGIMLSNINFDEKEAASEILRIFAEWQKIKKDLKAIISKMRDTWQQESKKETYGGYYG